MSVIDESADDDSKSSNGDTRYKLVGIIVHSGQANGGHYYSFVQNKFVESKEKQGESRTFAFQFIVEKNQIHQILCTGINLTIRM